MAGSKLSAHQVPSEEEKTWFVSELCFTLLFFRESLRPSSRPAVAEGGEEVQNQKGKFIWILGRLLIGGLFSSKKAGRKCWQPGPYLRLSPFKDQEIVIWSFFIEFWYFFPKKLKHLPAISIISAIDLDCGNPTIGLTSLCKPKLKCWLILIWLRKVLFVVNLVLISSKKFWTWSVITALRGRLYF